MEVNLQFTIYNLQNGIQKLLDGESKSETVEIVVTRTPPKVTTDKVNELGIRERIGRGESYYQYSIPNRIYNVALASSRLNSALIAPGEEFSLTNWWEKCRGHGIPRHIISGGRTILETEADCASIDYNVRAAMSAGLLYSSAGDTHTAFHYELNSKTGWMSSDCASKDFLFKNDTPEHILIQTINDPKNYF